MKINKNNIIFIILIFVLVVILIFNFSFSMYEKNSMVYSLQRTFNQPKDSNILENINEIINSYIVTITNIVLLVKLFKDSKKGE